jgi:hypothetical protein
MRLLSDQRVFSLRLRLPVHRRGYAADEVGTGSGGPIAGFAGGVGRGLLQGCAQLRPGAAGRWPAARRRPPRKGEWATLDARVGNLPWLAYRTRCASTLQTALHVVRRLCLVTQLVVTYGTRGGVQWKGFRGMCSSPCASSRNHLQVCLAASSAEQRGKSADGDKGGRGKVCPTGHVQPHAALPSVPSHASREGCPHRCPRDYQIWVVVSNTMQRMHS